MRNALAVTVLFSSLLLHAQSVQKGSSVTLEAHNEAAGAVLAGSSQPVTNLGNTSQPVRISTGVIWPRLIAEPSFKVSESDFEGQTPGNKYLIVSFRVDENGKTQNVHLTKSANPTVDERVAEAVRNYRYLPATLDNRNVAVDVNLKVTFER